MSVADWDNEYARTARLASQIRSGLGGSGAGNAGDTATTLSAGINRLDAQLDGLHTLSPTEIQRRRRLLQNLKETTTGSTATTTTTSGGGGASLMPTTSSSQQQNSSHMSMAMRQQDEMLDELAVGVGRLKTQTVAINDEARMHVNLLENMDNNLDSAQAGLEDQTRRAARLKEDQSVWRLQLIAAALFVLLILLILMGLSP